MTFGIDLGTTNSLIGRGETLYTDLVSSNVDIKRRVAVKRDEVGEDIVSSYKTNMSISETGALPRTCSSIVLKELTELATRRSGADVKDVIISVPAYFLTSQREAVKEAAREVGLNPVALINEPTAAALYTCRNIKDLVLVYDLGGGTFDISLIDSRVGMYTVIATDGIILGGDDLDLALAENAIKECKIPVRFRSKVGMKHLKSKMRLAKEQIQKTRSNVIVDFNDIGIDAVYTLTPNVYKETVKRVFGKTIEMTQHIIGKTLSEFDKAKITFVGGSAQCPYLKELLKEEIELEEIPCEVSPDLIVAKGVALFAEMWDEGIAWDMVEDVTKRLCIEDDMGKTITFIESNSIIPISFTRTLSNSKRSSTLEVKMYQGDSILASECGYVGTLIYNYGRVVEEGQGDVDITISVGNDGIVTLRGSEIFSDTLPQEIQLVMR